MMIRIVPVGIVTCVVALVIAGCGGAASTEDGDVTSAGSSAEPTPDQAQTPAPADPTEGPAVDADAADFCADLDTSQARFALIEISLATDWSVFDEAATALAAVEPPPEIAGDWKTVADFYAHIGGLFDGVDFADSAAVTAVIENDFGPETEAGAKTAQDSIAAIEAYGAAHCAETAPAAGADLDDACTLLTDEDLDQAFPLGIPEPRSITYAPDTMECIWADDEADVEVSMMMVPLADFQREFIDTSTPMPTGEIDGLPGGNTYKGVLGIGRFSTTGHSVSFTTDTLGGFVSVDHGADSRAVDVGTASRLALVVVGQL